MGLAQIWFLEIRYVPLTSTLHAILWVLASASESKKKAHARSINKLSYSNVMPHYCSTGSSDGYLRVWVCIALLLPTRLNVNILVAQDLRNLSKEFLHVHHSFAIRTVIFSPSILEPLHAITGLVNGSLCR